MTTRTLDSWHSESDEFVKNAQAGDYNMLVADVCLRPSYHIPCVMIKMEIGVHALLELIHPDYREKFENLINMSVVKAKIPEPEWNKIKTIN